MKGEDIVNPLRSLFEPVLSALCTDGLFGVAAELVSDVLSNYSGFLVEAHYDALFSLLQSPWAHERYSRLVKGDFDFDSVQFGHLMLALGDSRVQTLIESLDGRNQTFLTQLRGLVGAQGYPASDDRIFVPALEFWSTFVETFIDSMYSEEGANQSWVTTATSHILEVVSTVWRKIAFPPTEELTSWDSNDRLAFGDARKDVADLLQSTFTVVGPPLVSTFADILLQRLSAEAWFELEGAAFCLGSLADCVVADACDDALKAVFSSQLFNMLQQSRDSMPSRTRQTCISLIERYAEFFERDTSSLPAALRLLFSVLPDATLTTAAAKSIFRLCSSSRRTLAAEADAFLGQYTILASQQQIDCLAAEKVLGAIASVVQAVPSDEDRLNHLDNMLAFVQQDVAQSQKAASSPDLASAHKCLLNADTPDMAEHLALKALRSLSSIGKGFQAPLEGPVDLEQRSHEIYAHQRQRLAQIHSGIMAIIQGLQSSFPRSGDVVETICSVLRTGFSESGPAPFVFPPEMVAGFLIQQSHSCPRLGLFVSTACSFISSLNKSSGPSGPDIDLIRSHLLIWVINLLRQISGKPPRSRFLVRLAHLSSPTRARTGSRGGPERHRVCESPRVEETCDTPPRRGLFVGRGLLHICTKSSGRARASAESGCCGLLGEFNASEHDSGCGRD